MIKLKSTALILLTAAALAGCGAGAGAPPAASSAGTAASTAAAAETSAGEKTADVKETTDGKETADGKDAGQHQTVIGELYKLSGEEANWKGLTGEEKLEDFDYLYQTLKENFPYLELIKRAKGVDMDKEYETYRAKVEDTETDMQFFVLIQQFIGKGGGTGHLDLLTPGFYDWMTEAYQQEDGIPEEELPRMRLLAEEYTNAASAAAYGAMADVFQETMDRVAAHNAALAAAEPAASEPETADVDPLDGLLTEEGETDNLRYGILSAETPKIAYIQINSFDMSCYEEDKITLGGLYKAYEDFDHVIFDLTDNGGGGMSYFNDLMAAPNIDRTLSANIYALVKDGSLNRKIMDLSNYRPVSELPSLPRMNQDDLKELDLFLPDTYTVEPSGSEKVLKGKLWILVNENVYSSSEYAAMFTKATGFATLVGRVTGGDGIGEDPIPIVMKNSGLIVRYSPVYGVTPDGAGSQEFGTEPDIMAADGESELAACLKAIKMQ